jgi:hypothetical protein
MWWTDHETAMTLLDALVASLAEAAIYNPNDVVAPAAVLWTDRDELWRPLILRLRERLPVLTLGAYDPTEGIGPAIWLRCMLARALPEADWEPGAIPVIYLPGVSRADFRNAEACPQPLLPLLELQYRGVLWSQRNGKDWTVAAYLQSADGGIELPVASDDATKEALKQSLAVLADEPVEMLRKAAPLKADYLHALLHPDLPRTLLGWMNDPSGVKDVTSPEEWAAFCASCESRYRIHPEADGPVTAAVRLGEREGAWEEVWIRFAEAPSRYPNLPDLLRKAKPVYPPGLLEYAGRASWPQDNEAEEEALRQSLVVMDGSPAEAYSALKGAEDRHRTRREWVWSELGRSPLADTLPALLQLAEATRKPLSGSTPEEMARAYVEFGWEADAAALKALSDVEAKADTDAVRAAVETLYRPWLEEAALRFQKLVAEHTLPIPPEVDKRPGRCLLFADALRYDVAVRLADRLRHLGLSVEQGWRFTALPTVTPTAKPAMSPIADLLKPGKELTPSAESGSALTITTFRKLLEDSGVAVLLGDEIGDPSGTAWTEAGQFDSVGHAEGWRLARRIDSEVRSLAERVTLLLDGGWSEVRIVTDHGWLLLPGGLPKVELPEHLTEERKGRCARLRPDTQTSYMVVPWRWDSMTRIAVAPGIACFVAGKEYEHGGVSVQECVVPVLTVRQDSGSLLPQATIESIKWSGFRCNVMVGGETGDLVLDLRTKAGDAASSVLLSPKPFSPEGSVSVAVPDDSLEGCAVVAVVLNASAETVAQQSTLVGG